jgi:hypothetical protein
MSPSSTPLWRASERPSAAAYCNGWSASIRSPSPR